MAASAPPEAQRVQARHENEDEPKVPHEKDHDYRLTSAMGLSHGRSNAVYDISNGAKLVQITKNRRPTSVSFPMGMALVVRNDFGDWMLGLLHNNRNLQLRTSRSPERPLGELLDS
jgi:hypothetical protein